MLFVCPRCKGDKGELEGVDSSIELEAGRLEEEDTFNILEMNWTAREESRLLLEEGLTQPG